MVSKAAEINEQNTTPKPPGRQERKRRATRARLLEAGYRIMSNVGIADAKIKDITDLADVGFGTFYNYFDTKDDLASQILDCIINDFGLRNNMATSALPEADQALVMSVSARLVVRSAFKNKIWQWWALRPDLLVDRMREGFAPFGMRDMTIGLDQGVFHIDRKNIASAWGLSVWIMVAGIHDIVVEDAPPESEAFIIESMMRVLGVDIEKARLVSTVDLPDYPPSNIDWTFELTNNQDG